MAATYDTAQTPVQLDNAGAGSATPWTGPAYTPPAGSNRLVVAMVGIGSASGAMLPTGLTLGGQTMTPVGAAVSSGTWVSMRMFTLDEAGIAAMSGNASSITMTDTASQIGVIFFTLTLCAAVSGYQSGNATGTTPAPGTAVTSTTDGLVIAGCCTDQEGGLTVGSPGEDDSGQLKTATIAADIVIAAQYRAGTGGAVTPSWTQTSERYVVQAFNVAASAGGADLSVSSIGEPVISGSTF